jgi:hypothetical protein
MPTVSTHAVETVRRTLETSLFQWLNENNWLVVSPARQAQAEIYLKSLQASARARGERSPEWFLPYTITVKGGTFHGLVLDPQADVDFC